MLFDCLEFSEKLATTDVLYDVAFLVMDLDFLGHTGLANAILNDYLEHTGGVQQQRVCALAICCRERGTRSFPDTLDLGGF